MDNIYEAHINARKGKRHYREVKMVDRNPDRYLSNLQAMLENGEYKTAPYVELTRTCCNKIRKIAKLPYYPDRIIHHCIAQVLDDVWRKTLIRDTYSCIRGRGIHDGVKRVWKALRDADATRYCLKMDVRQFYPSLDHDVLKSSIRRKVKDRQVLAMIDEIIESWSPGVPIGNYLSQHFGNLYLSGYDHWMKETNRCRYYFRYCDDVVILGPDKGLLHDLRRMTEAYWRDRLNLTLKSNWQVSPVDVRGIDFLGYRFFRDYMLLRKSTALRFKRRIAQIKKRGHVMPARSILCSVMSYHGWMKPASCRNLSRTYFDRGLRKMVEGAADGAGVRNPLEKVMG